MKNYSISTLLVLSTLGFVALGVSACGEPDTVGEQVDETINNTGNALEEAGDNVEETLDQ